MANPIPAENLLTGTASWQPSKPATTQIQAYANQVGVDPGSNISFFVSTQVGGTTYSINIYRLGWYQGTGACLKQSVTGQTGVAQGYWDDVGQTLTNCPTAIINNTTHLIEAGWTSSYTWTVPNNAVTGLYLAQFTDANGYQTYCSFVVRGNASADYVFIEPVTTNQAYNQWGGYSLYTATPATKVSFNRPIVDAYGTAGVFRFEIGLIKFLEKQGYNLSYLTNIDVHTNASQLTNYKAVLFAPHDEYWSREMRDGVEAALASGVGLGCLGANCCYWQIRFEADASSVANRTITCYKVGSGSGLPLSNDPFYGVDNTRVTSRWRDAPVSRAENTLWGIMFTSYISGTPNIAWTVDAAANSSFLTGTGLGDGSSYSVDSVGYEMDCIQSGGPSNLQTIATTPFTDYQSNAKTQNTTVYQHASGAWVFASGAINWTNCLDSYRWTNPGNTAQLIVPEMTRFFINIMNGLIRNKAPKFHSGLMAHL